MPNDAVQLSLVVGSAALINTVYAVQKNRDAVVPLVGSGVMFAGLSIVGSLSNKWELPIAFAWVFLIASLIGRGIPLIQSSSALASAKPPNSSSQSGGSKGQGYSGGGGGGGGGGGR